MVDAKAASGGQISVSSVTASSNDGYHAPGMAIDGIESTSDYWGTDATVPQGRVPQWLMLDLGSVYSINTVTTHFYDGNVRTYTYYIEVSSDGSSWSTVVSTKTGNSIVTDTFTQIAARYVRITITGNTANAAAHIEEIRVYGSGSASPTPPPASNGQIAVSSVFASSNDGYHAPGMAIDGIESTSDYWGTDATVPQGRVPQWLMLDLGAVCSIGSVMTHFYDGNVRTYTYYIEVSSDGSSWSTVVSTKTGNSIVTDTFTQIAARYVRITITGNTANAAAHIEEIRVYGSGSASPTPPPASGGGHTSLPTGEIYLSMGAWLVDSAGNPNSLAKRIAAAHDLYGRPEWVETGNWGGPQATGALINYFHGHGIKVSCRIWSEYGAVPLSTILHDMNPNNGISGSVDYQMSIGPQIDMIMIDEVQQELTSYYATIRDYIHGLGKQVGMNQGSQILGTTPTLTDIDSVEFAWWYCVNNQQAILNQYPQKFLGASNDWGYSNTPDAMPPVTADAATGRPAYVAPMSEARAVWDTLYAWNHGIYCFDARPGDGTTLPSWWEDYLSQLP